MADNWNEYWKDPANLEFWSRPDKSVVTLLQAIDRSRVNRVLDLGCGIGRHSIISAKAGLNVTAMDQSPEALNILRNKMQEEGVSLKIIEGSLSPSLFPRNYYDLIIAFNVVYHGFRQDMQNSINVASYWLKQGGLFFFTCPTRRDGKFGNGEKVAPNTYRPLNSVHPGDLHYFSDELDLMDFLRGFRVKEKKIDEYTWNNNGNKQVNSYYQILAVKEK